MVDEHKKIVREGYDTIAESYLAARSESYPRDIELLQELTQRLPKGARVLDAGCGSGVPVTRILSQSFNVVGVDFSEEQIRLARELVPEAEFICQDITGLDFAEESFDAICSYYAIIHIPRDEHLGLLQSFYRMLKISGLALLCMGAGDLPEDIADDWLGTRLYWSHFDAETNLKMIVDCGFRIIWSRRITEQLVFGGGEHLFVLAQKD
ncbi:MAG TPA: methyltransferase domain-containing protein [Dehalococcoidia bacterium]|nr:methyltransferase domain-containing protein [Dehalococcoidia bacterium]